MNNIRNIHYEFNLLFSNKHQIVGRRDLVNSRRMSIGFLKELCPIILRGEVFVVRALDSQSMGPTFQTVDPRFSNTG